MKLKKTIVVSILILSACSEQKANQVVQIINNSPTTPVVLTPNSTSSPPESPVVSISKPVIPTQNSQVPIPSSSSSQTEKYSASWQTMDLQTSSQINDLSFLDFKTGWAVGNNGLIRKTLDAGATWEIQDIGQSNLNGVHFISKNQGWICGVNGVIRKTEDAGKNWILLDSGLNGSINAIQFENAEKGIFYTSTLNKMGLYDTNDGGKTWIKRFSGNSFDFNKVSIRYIGSQKAVITTESRALLYEGGSVNEIENTKSNSTVIKNTSIQNINISWLYGNNKKLFKSIDAGENWILQEKIITEDKIIQTPDVWGIAFSSELEGILIEGYNQYFTKNGGQSWTKTSVSINSSLFENPNGAWYIHDLHLFGDSQHAWGINPRGKVLRLGNP
jgi:photosystem II stability/assembly factor-like uncharacterized protein